MTMKHTIILLSALFGLVFNAAAFNYGDARFEPEDIVNFQKTMELLKGDRNLPMNQTVIKVAKSFLGTPYVARTLDKDPEMLTVNTRQTDCILFVEMCLALSLTSKEDHPTFEKYVDNLRKLRYRCGVVDGYASRIHYTSEWIIQGTVRGLYREVSREVGGTPLDQKFNFMSTHSNNYRQLKENPELVGKIAEVERNLETYQYWYVAQADLEKCLKNIKTGDIICFNSTVGGLDIAHVSYAYWENGVLTFIHASMGEMKVCINKKPLLDYVKDSKSINGVRVVRLY